MAFYNIEFKQKAVKELKSLPSSVVANISAAIDQLSINPYPSGCKKMAGFDHAYRIRVGDYRIIYELKNKELIILVIRIGHRREVYR